ncbi:UMTA methyltransferase family protein [Pseudomassariella vexata]|uniref:UMTA methyltransferase family protein n=1 Tax=Pseudomassariella vexata TaxID=1141098 RepID=A0A1Y2EHL7_9PEZI|nr:UMTA methyltransferase family protein [Pseudomassariella vexata]ORY71059.1 UMTA methyltransferase family protein [Pseudomassariella vexata]
MNGDLSWAPISEPANVLDIGTGTGIWAIEFADKNPTSNVVGTDLSLIRAQDIPPNCEFFRADAEENWIFDYSFDYIHLRLMNTCFDDPKGMVKKIFDHLQPDGLIEYQEFCFEQIAADEASELAIQNNAQSHQATERRTNRSHLSRLNPWPLDPKDKQIDMYSQHNLTEATRSTCKFMKALGMTESEIDSFLDGVGSSIADTSVHSYTPWYVVYGRKPIEGRSANVK